MKNNMQFIVCFLLVRIDHLILAQSTVIPENPIVTCSSKILNQGIPPDLGLNYIYLLFHNYSDTVLSIIGQTNRPFILSDELLLPPHELKKIIPSYYLIYSENLFQFSSLTTIDSTHPTWNPRARFLIILDVFELVESLERTLEIISKRMLRLNAYNFIILIKSLVPSSKEEIIDIYKWDPYEKLSKCGTIINIKKIAECDGKLIRTFTTDNLFHFSTNIESCTMRVAGFHWPPYVYSEPIKSNYFINGFNVLTVEALAHLYNIKLKYILVENDQLWGMKLNNGSWTGGLGRLQRNEADVLMGGCLQTVMRLMAFDSSAIYGPLIIKFFLALPGKLPHWKNMIYIFTFRFWVVIITIYSITGTIIIVLARASRGLERDYYRDFRNTFFTLFRIAAGTSTTILPSSKSIRAVFASWLVYTFHVNLVYTSALLGKLTTPVLEKPTIRSIKELHETKFPVHVVKPFLQISKHMDSDFDKLISLQSRPFEPTKGQGDIIRLVTRKDIAILDPEEHFEIIAQEKISNIYSLDDVIKLNQCMYVRRGSIFYQHVNTIQHMIMENGIFWKWRNDLVGTYSQRRHMQRNEISSLTLEELSGSFFVLLFGISLSIVSFVCEFLIFKLKKKEGKRNTVTEKQTISNPHTSLKHRFNILSHSG